MQFENSEIFRMVQRWCAFFRLHLSSFFIIWFIHLKTICPTLINLFLLPQFFVVLFPPLTPWLLNFPPHGSICQVTLMAQTIMLHNIVATRKEVPAGRHIHGLLKSLVSVVSSHQARNAAQREDDELDSMGFFGLLVDADAGGLRSWCMLM